MAALVSSAATPLSLYLSRLQHLPHRQHLLPLHFSCPVTRLPSPITSLIAPPSYRKTDDRVLSNQPQPRDVKISSSTSTARHWYLLFPHDK
ncbi:hypothetical protein SCHPADRAFT_447811 [Schizopora paradoxa]|uniref:Uncharacterized protein n=1 Tax=Schizopora paradoxa TaxID=27342 RepID=A0A0H2S4X4_9AGAM|nr:hypothetical protein SCHPADRAFT_447811 [Schizopora paradoxa]